MNLDFETALAHSVDYLSSAEAQASLRRDPYWPKWNTPWWHLLLLQEIGRIDLAPASIIEAFVDVLKSHYLAHFPLRESEIPAGTDPYRHIACHCAVGSAARLLHDAGVNLDERLPWIRPWLLNYQMSDGGWNCDEKAYLKDVPKSSIVSTVPCLEALLFATDRPLSSDEERAVDRGANYLLRHSLFRRESTGAVIDPDWLEIRFPRFYDYDFLRGFAVLKAWSRRRSQDLPVGLVAEVAALVANQWQDGSIILRRRNMVDRRSYNPSSDGWQWGDAATFPLFEAVTGPDRVCESLTKIWKDLSK